MSGIRTGKPAVATRPRRDGEAGCAGDEHPGERGLGSGPVRLEQEAIDLALEGQQSLRGRVRPDGREAEVVPEDLWALEVGRLDPGLQGETVPVRDGPVGSRTGW